MLVAYAQLKLQALEEFYADPAAAGAQQELCERVRAHGFFNADNIARLDAIRAEMGMSMLRFFHFQQHDWDKMLGLDGHEMKTVLMSDPDARTALMMFNRPICHPLAAEDMRGLLYVSARVLAYGRAMLEGSAQRVYLERRGVFRSADINDLLNFLDLLEIKDQYRLLARAAFALPGMQRSRAIKAQKEAFQARLVSLKENLKESTGFSREQERQIDEFIKAGAHIYLINRLAALPQRAAAAKQALAAAILPKPQQLVLDLDYEECLPRRGARPTRGPLPAGR